MLRVVISTLLLFSLFSCSSTKNDFIYEKQEDKPASKVETVENGDKPATFDDYKVWRKANDPSGQTYAEYKEWEAAYKQWLKDQAQTIQ